MECKLPHLITTIVNQLKSHAKSNDWDVVLATLLKMVASLGPHYLPLFVLQLGVTLNVLNVRQSFL